MEAAYPHVPFPVVPIPTDGEGYTQSFSAEQVDQYLAFLRDYGFVVLDNILDTETINATLEEIWKEVENFDWTVYDTNLTNNKVSRNDTTTWIDTHFPTSKVSQSRDPKSNLSRKAFLASLSVKEIKPSRIDSTPKCTHSFVWARDLIGL